MKFENYIRENKKGLQHQEDLSDIWQNIDAQIPAHKKRAPNQIYNKFFLAVAIIGLICFSIYYFIPHDKTKIDKSLYAQLDNSPPLTKILNIKHSELSDHHSDEIMETLIHFIRNDQNTNVRLAAIRAVEKYIEKEAVKITLIDLLATEKEPYITVAILNILKRGKVKESLPAFDEIIQKEAQVKFVKEEALKGQALLKNI